MPRTNPPYVGNEDELLWAFLDYCRDTLVLKTDGLDAAQLDTRLPPSTMTLGGMLSHMAFVEDWWFSVRLLGNEPEPTVRRRRLGGRLGLGLAHRRRPLARGAARHARPPPWRAAASGWPACDLDAVAATTTHSGEPFTLRWVVLHMVEEYARHNGHADLLRESIDGSTGD